MSYDAGFLHMGRLRQEQPVARGISQILVVGGTKRFLPAAEFTDYVSQVLCGTQAKKCFKIP